LCETNALNGLWEVGKGIGECVSVKGEMGSRGLNASTDEVLLAECKKGEAHEVSDF